MLNFKQNVTRELIQLTNWNLGGFSKIATFWVAYSTNGIILVADLLKTQLEKNENVRHNEAYLHIFGHGSDSSLLIKDKLTVVMVSLVMFHFFDLGFETLVLRIMK